MGEVDLGEPGEELLPDGGLHADVVAQTVADHVRAIVAAAVAVGMGLDLDPFDRVPEDLALAHGVSQGHEHLAAEIHGRFLSRGGGSLVRRSGCANQ